MIKIGLLGGSFNPAHSGHLHISEIALKKLGLQQIWWLVSPQNPLKPQKGMMAFEKRFASAKKIAAKNPRFKILDIEEKLGTQFTVDTIQRLIHKFPNVEFVWLMGGDNLLQFEKWKNWKKILRLVEVHVFDRSDYFYPAIKSKPYIKFPGRITYHHIRRKDVSSTEIRSKRIN